VRKLSSALAGVAAGVLLGLMPSTVAAEDAPRPYPLVVILDDRAQVFGATLDQAVKEATRVYRQAGVTVAWRTAGANEVAKADDQVARRAFTVRVTIQAKLRATSERTVKFQMGAAPATGRDCGGTVYVFYDQVEGFSKAQRIDPAMTLGTVIAHEAGHLLLRQVGHSAEGLMHASWDSADWQRAATGALLFSNRDVTTIRATTSSCGGERRTVAN
jgi:hypothetical protein